MSLINQMLKDLEKRRSRDLETSDSLKNNITWETQPESKQFNFQVFAIVVILFVLLTLIAYLFWERTTYNQEVSTINNEKIVVVETNKPQLTKASSSLQVNKTINESKVTKNHVSKQTYAKVIETDNIIDTEEIDNEKPLKVKKKSRPLNKEQLAEIEYKKGYQSLQRGQLRKGKEHLHEALLHFSSHLKAREMLSGIYIKSGHYAEAASLLREGIALVPGYALFAKLYARVLLEQNNPQLAIEILERGAKAADVGVDYHALLAATYQRIKNHNKAIEIYLKLVKVKPSVGIWWLGLAISLEKSGKNKEALEAYQRAQKTGNLKSGMVKFINNRVLALKEIGFPNND